MKKTVKALHFLLKESQFCINVYYIEKILPLPLLKSVPTSPIYCAGLMNLKNKCVPVLDLALCMGLTRNQVYPLNILILLCSDGIHQLGLIVDKVLGLSDIEEEKIEMHEELESQNSLFSGAVPMEHGMSLLINMDWVFALKLTGTINQFATDYE